MGTLSTTLDSVRIRIKDRYKNEFTDEELIILVTEIMEGVHENLRRMESNLVLETSDLATVSGTSTYALTGIDDIVEVWCNYDEEPLTLLMIPVEPMDSARPVYYTMLPSGELKLTPTPDAVYTLAITNCNHFTAPTSDTLNTYDFPWSGIWDRAIMRALVLECLSILERSVGVASAQAQAAHDEAVIQTYTHGIIRRTRRGRLFDGI